MAQHTQGYYTTEIEERIASWTASALEHATPERPAVAVFEQCRRDMRHAGYALPRAVVEGVKAALAKAEGRP